jgi:hypothetical protein
MGFIEALDGLFTTSLTATLVFIESNLDHTNGNNPCTTSISLYTEFTYPQDSPEVSKCVDHRLSFLSP